MTLDSMRSSNFLTTTVCTIVYMAPEILANLPYNYKVDVYAYSIMAYEIITAKSPIGKCKNITQFRKMVIEGYRPDTSSIKEKFNDGYQIVELLERCWSNNPSERPTFAEIVEMLEEKWFYSKFNVDENEVKEYLKLFEGESLKEDILEPTTLLNISKTTSNASIEPNIKTQDSNTSIELNTTTQNTNKSIISNISKITQNMNKSITPNISKITQDLIISNKTTQDSSAPDSIDYLDIITVQTIEKLISSVFDQPFFSQKKN